MNEKNAPCQQAGSGVDQANCMILAFQKADKELNTVYVQYLAKSDLGEQNILRASERLWVKFRDADCAAEYHEYHASGASIAKFACMEALTRQRLADLKVIYGWR